MSDVSFGPVSTLPGHSGSGKGDCDDHPGVPAAHRIQGETDSFGAEYHDLCADCAAKMRAEIAAEREIERRCDWCGNMAKTRPRRDFEEGLAGRVYDVCGDCVRRENDRLREERLDEDL